MYSKESMHFLRSKKIILSPAKNINEALLATLVSQFLFHSNKETAMTLYP